MKKPIFAIIMIAILASCTLSGSAFAEINKIDETTVNEIKRIQIYFTCWNEGSGQLIYAFYPDYVWVEVSKGGNPAATQFSYEDFENTIQPHYTKLLTPAKNQC